MAHYLVVANQTADSPELARRCVEIAREDRDARFSLLVPETPVEHLLTWETGETQAKARERADAGRRALEHHGLRVEQAATGDSSPMLAIDDALRAQPDAFDAIVLSTLRPGLSRWLERNVVRRAERRFGLPTMHVFEGGEAAWERSAGARREAIRRAEARAAGTPSRERRLAPVRDRSGALMAAGLALIYLVLIAGLALSVDPGFWVNGLVAGLVFGGFLLAARRIQHRELVD